MQGVGFRPTLCRAARAAGLGGSIRNEAGSVLLVLVASETEIDAFINALPETIPPLSQLQSVECIASEDAPDAPPAPFTIDASAAEGTREVAIPADLALCPACRCETFDPSSRRYGYAFTTCTDCGPRYTVLTGMPYDRANTTLAPFDLCDDCRSEYSDHTDRRFHAETIACPRCGPTIWLGLEDDIEHRAINALHAVRRALANDKLIAVRSVGGYLIAASPHCRETIIRLRRRKQRPHKPFALMAANMQVVRKLCHLSPAEASLLSSPQAPIVILRPHPRTRSTLPVDLISPDTDTLGVMLPSAPLHELLFQPLKGDPLPPFDVLIMTSGNRRSEPICTTNDEARERLQGIADGYLMHNRPIHLRCDDSLAVLRRNTPQIWRRARGYAPTPLSLPAPITPDCLCMGADLKSVIGLGSARQTILSPHLGDLDTPEAVRGLEQAVTALVEFTGHQPKTVAVDAHPDYISARIGRRWAAAHGAEVAAIQHHVAHGMACLAEHGHHTGLALALDGTGYGPDGTIWGAELLDISGPHWQRRATLAPVPLPGGDAAVRHPRRQLAGRWQAQGFCPSTDVLTLTGITPHEWATWQRQAERHLNAPLTHAAGRLFDTVAVLLGLAPEQITYEGQAAIRLEAAARAAPREGDPLPWRMEEHNGLLQIDWSPTIALLSDTARPNTDPAPLAWRFHLAVAHAAAAMIRFGLDSGGARRVALSGGVMMNALLHDLLTDAVNDMGVELCTHQRVPPNDGGIAFGQAAWMACHESKGT